MRIEPGKVFVVRATRDEEAKVWVAESEDVPGLATEAETLDAMLDRLRVMIPELLEANDGTIPDDVPFELLTRQHVAGRHSRYWTVNDFAPALKRALREAGCRFQRRGRGDHEIWYSPVSGRSFTVDSKIKLRHTATGVLKQTGLPKQF